MNLKHPLSLVALVLALVLTACAPAPTTLPSATLRPTNKPQVLPPTFTPLPPTATVPVPTATIKVPTRTTSPTAPPASLAFMHISQPAAGSKITSPVKISGESNSTFEQNLVVAVYDATGKRLALKPTTIQAEMGRRGAFSAELAFTVAREQAGRVVVYDTSPAHGGILHLVSAEVTLRPAGGKAELLAATAILPLLQIYSPTVGAVISGGVVKLNGYGGPIFENQFSAKLCGAGSTGLADPICGTAGNVLARAQVTLAAPDAGKPGPFSIELAYQVKQKTPAWVVIYDQSPRDGELIFVNSLPVQLLP